MSVLQYMMMRLIYIRLLVIHEYALLQVLDFVTKESIEESNNFKDKYLVTGHLPTRAIDGAKPDKIN